MWYKNSEYEIRDLQYDFQIRTSFKKQFELLER